MEFKKIQLNGFKSFAQKTNFLIEKGLTGIVGPNGCGKSNIVESLRWCMGETSAKSMRGSGMEDVIFSGTSNKPSKNIAEVVLSLNNENKDGPHQYNDLEEIEIRRKIEKDKGSKFYINNKEVRAKDAQMFFADLSTGAHSPSVISQGRIGAVVTAKPSDRRAILEEAAGIAGLHVRRHEAEIRLGAAENNLKRADELRRQQEKQLANLEKQAEEAAKYKLISEEIKKVEAGLYYLRLLEIDKEITLENEVNNEADGKVEEFNKQIEELETKIKNELERVEPIRQKNIENLSKIQRLNLELKALDEESTRINEEIDTIKSSIKVIDEDIDREKSIVIDANSNEKRLKEERNILIDTDSKYYETEKLSNQDLENSKSKLKSEQDRMDVLLEGLSAESLQKNNEIISNIKSQIEEVKKLISENRNHQTIKILDECIINLSYLTMKVKEVENDDVISTLTSKSDQIKKLQDDYAETYSKNQNIKNESVKRKERISIIDQEFESWQNLLTNSEKMVNELNTRKNKLLEKLNALEKQPQSQAEKKGKISENLRISENEKNENEILVEKIVNELNTRKNKLVEKLNVLEKQPQSQAEKKGKISENLRISENEKNENEILVEKIDNLSLIHI